MKLHIIMFCSDPYGKRAVCMGEMDIPWNSLRPEDDVTEFNPREVYELHISTNDKEIVSWRNYNPSSKENST